MKLVHKGVNKFPCVISTFFFCQVWIIILYKKYKHNSFVSFSFLETVRRKAVLLLWA